MSKTLHVELKLYRCIEDGDEVSSEHISEVIADNESEFYELMARVCSKRDMRAELLSESLQVDDVNISGSGGVVCVEYEYDAYYGCKDIDGGDCVQDEWEFRIKGNKLIFDLDLPEIERYDEI